jgi:hypothetical protein
MAAAVSPRAVGVAALAVVGVGVAGVAGVMVGIAALAALVLLGQVMLAWSWTRRQRASAGTAVIVAVASVACDVTLLARESTQIGDVAGVVGVGVVVVVLYQLARRRIGATSKGTSARGADRARWPKAARSWRSRAAGGRSLQITGPKAARSWRGRASEGTSPGNAVGGGPGEPARVTVDMAVGLGGVGLVALLAVVLTLDVRDGGVGRACAAAGLLGVGVGVGAARLTVVTVAGWGGDVRAEIDWRVGAAVAAAVGVVVGAAAGAALGALADISVSEGAAVAVAGAVAALAVESGLARGLLVEGGVGEAPASTPPITPPMPAPTSAGSVPASAVLAALFPFAAATPVVYLVGRLLFP